MQEMKWVIADLNQTMSVKEQRVDGSSVKDITVRCTLVAGKPVLERKNTINYFFYIFRYIWLLLNTVINRYNDYVNKFIIQESKKKKSLSVISELNP